MRKHILFILTLLMTSLTVTAKESVSVPSTETFYIQLVSTQRIGNRDVSAQIELGSEFAKLTGCSEGFAATVRGNRYPSLLDALNSLAVNGWKLADSYTIAAPGGTQVVWVLQKTVVERAELLDGLGN